MSAIGTATISRIAAEVWVTKHNVEVLFVLLPIAYFEKERKKARERKQRKL